MFEDFENRSGFWKDLGSNFTINYSGDAPSFLTSGEMWSSMDGSETQTLAAWENGWVLTNNPDGTMTATPKYTSGLISKTLVRVPVGPQAPMSSPTGGVGGVQVAFTADNKTFAADQTIPSLAEIFRDGHPLVERFEIHSASKLGVHAFFPEDDVILITGSDGTTGPSGSAYDPNTGEQVAWRGTSMTIRAIDGYEVYVGGYEGQGYGKTIKPKDFPYRHTIYIIGPDGTKYIPTFAGSSTKEPKTITPNGGSNGGSDTDPNDCAGENRALNTDDSCGDCLSDYTEDANGDCIADATEEEEGINWLLWGGLAAVGILAFTM